MAQTAAVVAAAAVSSVAGITPTVNGSLLVLGFSGGDNGTISALSTANIAAGSWTALGASVGTNTGADGSIHGAYHVQTTAAATGNAQGTLSIAGRNALFIASFPSRAAVTTGAQTTLAATQSAGADVDVAVTGAQTTSATTQTGTISPEQPAGKTFVKSGGVWKEPALRVKHAGTWKEPATGLCPHRRGLEGGL